MNRNQKIVVLIGFIIAIAVPLLVFSIDIPDYIERNKRVYIFKSGRMIGK